MGGSVSGGSVGFGSVGLGSVGFDSVGLLLGLPELLPELPELLEELPELLLPELLDKLPELPLCPPLLELLLLEPLELPVLLELLPWLLEELPLLLGFLVSSGSVAGSVSASVGGSVGFGSVGLGFVASVSGAVVDAVVSVDSDTSVPAAAQPANTPRIIIPANRYAKNLLLIFIYFLSFFLAGN